MVDKHWAVWRPVVENRLSHGSGLAEE